MDDKKVDEELTAMARFIDTHTLAENAAATGHMQKEELVAGSIKVRTAVLIPALLYLRKFFQKIEATNRNAPSRFVDPEEFELAIRLKGFTPEDFNSLQSLGNSLLVELADEIRGTEELESPQMARQKMLKAKTDGARYMARKNYEKLLVEKNRPTDPPPGERAALPTLPDPDQGDSLPPLNERCSYCGYLKNSGPCQRSHP